MWCNAVTAGNGVSFHKCMPPEESEREVCQFCRCIKLRPEEFPMDHKHTPSMKFKFPDYDCHHEIPTQIYCDSQITHPGYIDNEAKLAKAEQAIRGSDDGSVLSPELGLYSCGLCSMTFPTRGCCRNHRRFHHRELPVFFSIFANTNIFQFFCIEKVFYFSYPN